MHYERFGGTVGRYIAPDLEDLTNGYDAVNKTLKKVCEEDEE